MALAALFVSAAIFYFVDPGGGAGKEIFEKILHGNFGAGRHDNWIHFWRREKIARVTDR